MKAPACLVLVLTLSIGSVALRGQNPPNGPREPDFDRQLQHFDVPMQVGHEVAPRRKQRDAPVERHPRESGQMLSCVQRQAVIQVRPRVPYGVTTLQHHVLDATAAQLGRRRKASRPSTHHHHRIAISGRQAGFRRGRRRTARPSGSRDRDRCG